MLMCHNMLTWHHMLIWLPCALQMIVKLAPPFFEWDLESAVALTEPYSETEVPLGLTSCPRSSSSTEEQAASAAVIPPNTRCVLRDRGPLV